MVFIGGFIFALLPSFDSNIVSCQMKWYVSVIKECHKNFTFLIYCRNTKFHHQNGQIRNLWLTSKTTCHKRKRNPPIGQFESFYYYYLSNSGISQGVCMCMCFHKWPKARQQLKLCTKHCLCPKWSHVSELNVLVYSRANKEMSFSSSFKSRNR